MKHAVLFVIFVFLFVHGFTQEKLATNKWEYIQIDTSRMKWGDFQEPEWLRYFGIDMQDINYDGYLDIISGRYVYLNPGGSMEGIWSRVDLGFNVDGFLFIDVDNDEYADAIALALPDVYWLEADNLNATAWKAMKISNSVPATGHINAQGYLKADVIKGGKEEILFSAKEGIYMAEIPENPVPANWKFVKVGMSDGEEGFDVGDIDGDGDLDIVASVNDQDDEWKEPRYLHWFENPGAKTGEWKDYKIAKVKNAIDRVRVEDFNADGILDIAITEERFPGPDPDANLYVFTGSKKDGTLSWKSKVIVTQYSMNNLDAVDVDNDGDIDLVTNEHKGENHKTQLFINDGKANFIEQLVDTGKECHLGTIFSDLDNDGDLDIVGHAWDNYKFMHVWRNDAIVEEYKWEHLSTANNQLPVPVKGNQQTALLVADLNNDNLPEIVVAERTESPALTCLYNLGENKYEKIMVDDGPLNIEAGSAYADIDDDGDIDLIFGGDGASNQVWWWENPYPEKEGWKRHLIKDSGYTKHHDIAAGDFDQDGKVEVVFWNQSKEASALFMAEIPKKPAKHKGEWELLKIYDYSYDSEMQPVVGLYGYPGYPMVNEHEGLTIADINLDGNPDIVGGGHWFQFKDDKIIPNVIDASYQFTRSAAGQLIKGGRPEVVLTLGDGDGPMYMYYWHEWEGWKGIEKGTGTWARMLIDNHIHFGHSLQIIDFNQDGINDIFLGEMSFNGENSTSRLLLYRGLGHGKFKRMLVDNGIGAHESRMADMDNDGDLDIVNKPYTWSAPRIDLYINTLNQ